MQLHIFASTRATVCAIVCVGRFTPDVEPLSDGLKQTTTTTEMVIELWYWPKSTTGWQMCRQFGECKTIESERRDVHIFHNAMRCNEITILLYVAQKFHYTTIRRVWNFNRSLAYFLHIFDTNFHLVGRWRDFRLEVINEIRRLSQSNERKIFNFDSTFHFILDWIHEVTEFCISARGRPTIEKNYSIFSLAFFSSQQQQRRVKWKKAKQKKSWTVESFLFSIFNYAWKHEKSRNSNQIDFFFAFFVSFALVHRRCVSLSVRFCSWIKHCTTSNFCEWTKQKL